MGGVRQITGFDAERAAWFPQEELVWFQTKVPELDFSQEQPPCSDYCWFVFITQRNQRMYQLRMKSREASKPGDGV